MLGHALVYAGLFWLLAGLVARSLWAATPRHAGRIVLVVSLAGLALALVTQPYVTPV